MPCQDDYREDCDPEDLKKANEKIKQQKKQLDEVTAMLYAICEVIERHHPDSPIQQSAGGINGLREWWDKHKKLDEAEQERKRKRVAEDAIKVAIIAAKREERALARAALKKLTPAERKALGL